MEINSAVVSEDTSVNIDTPMSLRTSVEKITLGLELYKDSSDPVWEAWKNMVIPHVNSEDIYHYNTLWNTVVRNGPNLRPKL